MSFTQIIGRFFSVHTDDRTVQVQPRKQLLLSPDLSVLLGSAPDGLPLLLSISRTASVTAPVLRALG